MERRIRLGMVGGGQGAFIGAVHRIAARLDDRFTLVAGALSSTPGRAQASGAALGLEPARAYDTWADMAVAEAARSDGIEAVSIVTPNHMHAGPAKAFLAAGIHVICDKPLTATMAEARRLAKAVENADALFFLTHNYTAYPMVRQMREMTADCIIGRPRIVQVEYAQDWLTGSPEAQGNKQAEWRTDPARAGAGGALGDIGTHAHNLACFVTGQKVTHVAADLHSFGPGRTLDDNAHVLLRFDEGARGMLWCSQVAPGHENGLRLRIYGETGSLEWSQEQPNHLWHTMFGQARRLLTRAGPGSHPGAARIPAGHPEGYLEGFATLYSDIADTIRAHQSGAPSPVGAQFLPGIGAGLDGMAFVEACARSSKADGLWTVV